LMVLTTIPSHAHTTSGGRINYKSNRCEWRATNLSTIVLEEESTTMANIAAKPLGATTSWSS
jgi:hypothetical protein